MTKQNTRIDGEKNLASDAVVVGKKEKEKCNSKNMQTNLQTCHQIVVISITLVVKIVGQ